jgi:3-oxoadipate enol-lactonase
MPTATVNGVSTYYETHGDGSPVLFIHGGFGGNPTGRAEMGADAIEALEGAAQVINYHRRNSGESGYSVDHYALPDLAADARALLDFLGIDRSIIIGSSMGGMVALQYALDYPDAVSALALVQTGPALMASTGFGPPMARVVKQAAAEGDRGIFESRKDKLRSPRDVLAMATGPARDERLQELARLTDDELYVLSTGAIRNYEAFVGYDYTDRLSDIRMPAVIIHGDADPVVPFENAGILESGIPHAEFRVIADATHGLLGFEEAAAALRDWVVDVS